MDLVEIGLVALAVLIIGGLSAFLLVRLYGRHERRKHRRLSASRRQARTEFDLIRGHEKSDLGG